MRAFLYTGRVLFADTTPLVSFGRRDDRVWSFELHVCYQRVVVEGAEAGKYLVIGMAVFRQLPWDWKFWRDLDDTRVLTGLDAQQAYDEEFSKHI